MTHNGLLNILYESINKKNNNLKNNKEVFKEKAITIEVERDYLLNNSIKDFVNDRISFVELYTVLENFKKNINFNHSCILSIKRFLEHLNEVSENEYDKNRDTQINYCDNGEELINILSRYFIHFNLPDTEWSTEEYKTYISKLRDHIENLKHIIEIMFDGFIIDGINIKKQFDTIKEVIPETINKINSINYNHYQYYKDKILSKKES